ncbi:putative transcriptional regulator, GntR family [Methanobacterium lacus]|uniref:Putative transcriptional regulator, GntR family n=1 Tax=Methanobacterium lacus (strain AL-21) TaxID=877455 RepID=F0TAT6_METLA|nr:PLP-dependent aminotransferase family protein [Methanobacterium lacus]ADZ08962.1 putative transcriptional regulator, GntR family [Methanobacterium lacus]
MNNLYANRMSKIPRSFVREILKVADEPDIISFAGGLPNPDTFPEEEFAESTSYILENSGAEALQYSTTEGYEPLRKLVSERYSKNGLSVDPKNILITNGSQQGLDLVAKVFLNKDDTVLVEKPTYLAALQAFGLFEPNFKSIPLLNDGVDVDVLRSQIEEDSPKLFYSIPNFQNPTGISYSLEKRKIIGKLLNQNETILVEDNPYGEIRFMGENLPPIKTFTDNSILLGSFSKVVAPGIRLGWIVAEDETMHHLVTAKQASDLHSNFFSQMIVHHYLTKYDVEEHLSMIRQMYKDQRDFMVEMIKLHFPDDVKYTQPEGGMFLWVTLPGDMAAMELFERTMEDKVAFVPGEAFYSDDPQKNTLRLNFSNSNNTKIEEGIKKMGNAIRELKSQ